MGFDPTRGVVGCGKLSLAVISDQDIEQDGDFGPLGIAILMNSLCRLGFLLLQQSKSFIVVIRVRRNLDILTHSKANPPNGGEANFTALLVPILRLPDLAF